MDTTMNIGSFEVLENEELLLVDAGGLFGAIAGAILGFGGGLVTQCVKVIACEIVGYDGWGSSFSWAAAGAAAVRGAVAGALSPF